MSTSMPEAVVGRVASVDDKAAGSSLIDDHAAGELVLRVFDAADFPEAGGTVDVEGQVVTYTVADLELDTLTLVEPLVDPVESDAPVLVVPYAPTRVAVVEVDGSDEPITAVVPQNLLDQVPVGLRDIDTAETATVAVVDGQWTLRDLVAVGSSSVMHGQPNSVTDPETGAELGGMNPDGSSEWPVVRTAQLLIDGTDAMDLLTTRWLPLGEDRMAANVTYGPYTVDMPLWEGLIDVPPGHTVRLRARGWAAGNEGQRCNLQASYTATTDGSVPPVPSGSSEPLLPYAPFRHVSGTWEPRQWEWSFGAGDTSAGARFRVLVWLQPDPGGTPVSARNWVFTADIAGTRSMDFAGQVRAQEGPRSVTPPPPPVPPVVTRTKSWALTDHALWTPNFRNTLQPYASFVTAGRASSGYHRAYMSIPSAARTFASSSEEVVSARLRLTAAETPTTSWIPVVGTSTQADITSSEPSRRNGAGTSRTYSRNNPSGWTDLAATTLAALKAGDPTLYLDAPSTRQPYLRFHGTGASSARRPMLEITVRSRT